MGSCLNSVIGCEALKGYFPLATGLLRTVLALICTMFAILDDGYHRKPLSVYVLK
jgi:hypothetical protein